MNPLEITTMLEIIFAQEANPHSGCKGIRTMCNHYLWASCPAVGWSVIFLMSTQVREVPRHTARCEVSTRWEQAWRWFPSPSRRQHHQISLLSPDSRLRDVLQGLLGSAAPKRHNPGQWRSLGPGGVCPPTVWQLSGGGGRDLGLLGDLSLPKDNLFLSLPDSTSTVEESGSLHNLPSWISKGQIIWGHQQRPPVFTRFSGYAVYLGDVTLKNPSSYVPREVRWPTISSL